MAIDYEHSVFIERPVEDVYTYISDVTNAPEWMPWADEVSIIDGGEPWGVSEGQQRLLKQTDFGIQNETIIEATDVEPGRSYRFETVGGPVDFKGSYRFDPVENGTRLTRTYHVELPVLARLMEPIMARRMKRRWEADLQRVREILENQSE